ncbi:MAG: hypothetical protein BRC33_09645 [Cyanobacteria bacterium SW_9_44_58]|nr:MAG: hypothetical protein BRC33_09645 [Cyanobacteria bacterium SW_9_44_58]
MFLSELTPIFQEFTQQPMSFLGGLVSGSLRLNPNQEPLKSWLAQQGGGQTTSSPSNRPPQAINIE